MKMHKGHEEMKIALKRDILTSVQENDWSGIPPKEVVTRIGEDEILILGVVNSMYSTVNNEEITLRAVHSIKCL